MRETIDKPEKISPRREKQRRLAIAAMDHSRTYEEIGRELLPHVANPRQAVYNRLQDQGVQAELAKIAKTFDPEQIKAEVMTDLEEAGTMARDKGRGDWLTNTAMSKAKLAGLLVDKVQDVTDKANIRDMQVEADKVLSSLAVSEDGIQSSIDEQGQPI